MPFFDSFDGFFVIHSEEINPERLRLFSSELERVGISNYQVITPLVISDADPRLASFKFGSNRLVSLIDAFQRTVRLAAACKYSSVVIFEDDIRFRDNFLSMWSEVEGEANKLDWDVLVLHRKSTKLEPIVEKYFHRVSLVSIENNTGAYCVIIRSKAYEDFIGALDYCLIKGYPADFFYGCMANNGKGSIIKATSKNLTGVHGGLRSSLQGGPYGGFVTPNRFNSMFFCYRNVLEYFFYRIIRGI